ncbi:GD21739 [Drosophila simulans]|uniref:GD21739 n=1 Tax=Drosophila simulans TaxID=7240 RepID=B4QA23_DROSI|nr:GD21739 [Drosophila simulans]
MQVKMFIKKELSTLEEISVAVGNEGTTPICCAPTCLHQENSQFRFFCFPIYENTLMQWLVNTQMKPSLVSPFELYICHFHFEPTAVQETQLLRSAVPTLFLGHEEYLKDFSDSDSSDEESEEDPEGDQSLEVLESSLELHPERVMPSEQKRYKGTVKDSG